MNADVLRRLQLRPGQTLTLLNAPPDMQELIAAADPQLRVAEEDGAVTLLFVRDTQELATWAAQALARAERSIVWIAYPKRGGDIPTDLTRDAGWDIPAFDRYRAVSQVALTTTWSAVRWRVAGNEDPVTAQYAGDKAALLPIYTRLVELAQSLGSDVVLNPRQSYVALARGKQFALIAPTRRDRVDLALRLREPPTSTRLTAAGNLGSGSMTHKIALTTVEDVDDEIAALLRLAYDQRER